MKIWGHQDLDACPRCGDPEITAHILACKDEGAVWLFHDSVEMMGECMAKVEMAPDVQEAIK